MAPVNFDSSSTMADYVPRPKDRRRMSIDQVQQMIEILMRADAVCFDVDSTVCVDEAIDELANFVGVGEEVEQLTAHAMNGGVTFRKALGDRLAIMRPSMKDIKAYVKENPPKLTEGIRELVAILQKRGTQVYLVSGGFDTIIESLADELNIPSENVFANKLLFYYDGEYAGFDMNEPTSESGGKVRVVERLKAKFQYKNLVFIGDGSTDLETYPTAADAFIGFGGNQVRDHVKSNAPWYVNSFQEIIDKLKNQTRS